MSSFIHVWLHLFTFETQFQLHHILLSNTARGLNHSETRDIGSI